MDNLSLRTLTNQKVATLLKMLTYELRHADHMSKTAGWEYLSALAVNQLGGDTSRFSHQYALSYSEIRILFYQLVIAKLHELCEHEEHSTGLNLANA